MTRSSAGGAGNAGGVRHEDRCLAWALAHMLTESPLPLWASGQRVVAVGGQTERPVDDGGIVTGAGWVCIQAKKRLRRSEQDDSDLAKALEQHVAIAADGVPDRPPHQDVLRPLDPRTDRVLILTDEQAPTSVRVAMAELVERLGTWPAEVPLDEAAADGPERAALKALRLHLTRLWRQRHGHDADDGVLRSLFRPLAVRALDLRPEGADVKALLPTLTDLLEDQSKAPALWRDLEKIGQRLAVERAWVRRADLVAELQVLGHHLTAVARLRRDIGQLRKIHEANVSRPPSSLTLETPDGPVEVSRILSTALSDSTGNLAITGDPGVGKSVVLHGYAVGAASSQDVVYLVSGQLRGTAGDTRTELNLDHDLHDVLAGWPGSRPGLLILDGIDQTRGVDASAWLPILAEALDETRWRVVASIRSFDLRRGLRWRSMFPGRPVNPAYADPELPTVAHVLLGNLTADELQTVRTASPSMRNVIDGADPDLSDLLTNPFNLNILGELIKATPNLDLK